jgi:hypothetical protein
MKTATARLDIEVFVDCPHCDHLIDLVKPEDTAGYDHNEEGYVLSQACPNGHWSEEHKNFEVEEVECSSCGNTFNVKGLDW